MMAEESSLSILSEQEAQTERRTWRVAGIMLLLITVSRLLIVAVALDQSIFDIRVLRTSVIDLGLSIGLLVGWKGARTWVLWRAVAGGVLYTYMAITQQNYAELTAQLAISTGLLLALVGKPNIKRTVFGGALFAIGFVTILGAWIAVGAFDELSPSKRAINLLLDQGYTALHNEDYPAAVEALNKVLEQDPESALAYNGLGWAHHDVGEYEEALADYERAMKLEPRNVSFLVNHAITLDYMDRMEEALLDLDKAIELDNTNWELYGVRGWLYYELDHYDKAKQDLETALQKAPKDTDVTDVTDLLELLDSTSTDSSE